MKAPGYVTFQLNGETLHLEPVVTGNELFFMFKDPYVGAGNLWRWAISRGRNAEGR